MSHTNTYINRSGSIVIVIYGWFSYVVRESEGGLYDDQVDMSFRWGMAWFIFSEVMFFAHFWGLYYARELSLPWLAGDGSGVSTIRSYGLRSKMCGLPMVLPLWW